MNAKMIAYAGLLAAIQALLLVTESWLTQYDIGSPDVIKWIKALAGGVIIVGSALGAVYVAFQKLASTKTTAVNAALNLVASGNAVDAHGNPVAPGPGATPFLPATEESASKIVADYAPGASKP